MTETQIKASELRIGNWVTSEDDGHEQICLATFYLLYNSPTFIDRYEPIPLTPEILEKAGFRDLYKRGEYYKLKKSITYQVCKSRVNNRWYFQFKSAMVEKRIDYLHQLQNLYFALTGEELEINL